MGKGPGRCVSGDSVGPFSAVPSKGDKDPKRLNPYDQCGQTPQIMNGLNRHWSHSRGGACPAKAKQAVKAYKTKPAKQNITIGVTLRHFSNEMKPKQEKAIQTSLASVLKIPLNRTHVYISGLDPEENAAGSFRVEVLLTVLEVTMSEAPKLVALLDAAVSDGTLEKDLQSNGLENMKLANQTAHTAALLSHGTNSASSLVGLDDWPLPPLRVVELDHPLKTDDVIPPPRNLSAIHALEDHPHLSGNPAVRFKRSSNGNNNNNPHELDDVNSEGRENSRVDNSHSSGSGSGSSGSSGSSTNDGISGDRGADTDTVRSSSSSNGNGNEALREFLGERYKAAIALPGLEEGQKHVIATNYQRLQDCLQQPHASVTTCLEASA